jgi:hypothetical protein
MPTPFTHLAGAQHLLASDSLSENASRLMHAERPAFLAGAIAADAQTICGLTREQTHFYAYDRPMADHPYRVMLHQYPSLERPVSASQRAFLAGYAAHLAMDEVWTLQMTGPHFATSTWGTRTERFLALHLMLIAQDMRSEQVIDVATADALRQAQPQGWLPFMSDDLLLEWCRVIGRQLPPHGHSETLDVIAPRVGKPVHELRALLADSEFVQAALWQHVPAEAVSAAEQAMLLEAARQLETIVELTIGRN